MVCSPYHEHCLLLAVDVRQRESRGLGMDSSFLGWVKERKGEGEGRGREGERERVWEDGERGRWAEQMIIDSTTIRTIFH
jgi:hypothetical protein